MFNEEKALEAVIWIAEQKPGISVWRIQMILHWADIAGDEYTPSEEGPVPVGASELLVRGTHNPGALLIGKKDNVYALRCPRRLVFTEPELERLTRSFNIHAYATSEQLTDWSTAA